MRSLEKLERELLEHQHGFSKRVAPYTQRARRTRQWLRCLMMLFAISCLQLLVLRSSRPRVFQTVNHDGRQCWAEDALCEKKSADMAAKVGGGPLQRQALAEARGEF